jgi:hypothetical protein
MGQLIEDIFIDASAINKNVNKRPAVIFGRGATADKTRRLLSEIDFYAVVDNSPNFWNTHENGLQVFQPDDFITKNRNAVYYIICSTSYGEIAKQLLSFGLVPNADFCVSPVLSDYKRVFEIENLEIDLLFTSGAAADDNSEFGGGIYSLQLNRKHWEYKKQISGQTYGLIKYRENFIALSSELGIIEFNSYFDIIRSKQLPEGARSHGICFSEELNLFAIVSTYLDRVYILDSNFSVIDSIQISEKHSRDGLAHHHCNDCWTDGRSLFVSMFSVTGNWKKEVYDGGVVEYDLKTGERYGVVLSDLWMPHNVDFFDGSLTILDSLRGLLRRNNNQPVGKFPAFTRGLDYNGIYYAIGQSKNRNISKCLGVSLNTSVDSGIIIFDEKSKVSRFLQVDSSVGEIHAIRICNPRSALAVANGPSANLRGRK